MTTTTSGKPSLALPASEQVAAAGTIAVSGGSYTDSFAQDNPGALYLGISDDSGALYATYPAASGGSADNASGSGSDAITFQGSYADVQDIINSLTYVAAGSGGSDDIHYDIWNQAGTETAGNVPVTISNTGSSSSASIGTSGSTGSSGPALSEPASETVAAGATQAVSGSYSDSTAASNPGAMYLGITDSSGTLYATNASGSVVAGSGTGRITLNTDYADVNAVLKSLTYTAGVGAGSDSISFDIWNQAGVETTDTVPVSITSGASGGGSSTDTWTGAVSDNWNTAGNWSGNAVPVFGDSVIIPDDTPNNATLSNATLSGQTITLEGSGNSSPLVVFNDVTLDSVLQAAHAGQVQIGGTLTVGLQGTLEAGASAALTLSGTAETIVDNGLIDGSAGGYVVIYNGPSTGTAAARLINNGSIVADAGTINFASTASYPGGLPDWMFVNSGSVDITNGGGLALDGTFQGGDVAFTGTLGALTVEQGMAFADGATVSGFGPGDRILMEDAAAGQGGALGFANGTLDVTQSGTLVQAIPLLGSSGETLGNYEDETVAGAGNASTVVYAASGQPSGLVSPNIVAPASEAVAQSSTLALNGVSIENFGTSGSLFVDAGSGTLYMNGASGSGTHQLGVASVSQTQANADLASLTYVPAAGATSDTVSIEAQPPSPVDTTRSMPISISGGAPTLKETSSETVASSGTVAVGGSYSDSFAAGNPGSLYLGISDGSGTLSATNASGQTVAGSGTDNIAVQTDYVDVNAILASLHYTAGSSAGSDTIQFQVWNQAGVETIASTAVSIDAASFNSASTDASGTMVADFGSAAGVSTPDDTSGGSSGSFALDDAATHPIGILVGASG
jgi:filamentous hemagglutinin